MSSLGWGGGQSRVFCAPHATEGYLFRGYLPERHALKAPYSYLISSITFFCTLHSLIMPMSLQLFVVYIPYYNNKVDLNVYAMQKWWGKNMATKRYEEYIALQKPSANTTKASVCSQTQHPLCKILHSKSLYILVKTKNIAYNYNMVKHYKMSRAWS